jgi:hypothetical protein
MTPERRAQMFAELGDDAGDEWVFAARDPQLRPPDLGGPGSSLAGAAAEKPTPGSHAAVRASKGRD